MGLKLLGCRAGCRRMLGLGFGFCVEFVLGVALDSIVP